MTGNKAYFHDTGLTGVLKDILFQNARFKRYH